MNILVLEPYYGGSHRAFLAGLEKTLPHVFFIHSLPARKWKWRMRLAAPYFARLLDADEGHYDLILCSTFVDVAALKALLPDRYAHIPVLTYFHENQFVYPVQVEDERDLHFALTNMTTAMASDRLAFNSAYNCRTFLDGAQELLKKTPDMKLDGVVDRIREKSVVLPPGLDFDQIDSTPFPENRGSSPVIIWNHRWEHDKNPTEFFEALFQLDEQKVNFSLIVLGQAFERRPDIFAVAEKRLRHKIEHWGYVAARQEYIRLLKKGDLVVSTATHEFFGMAVLEAVRSGCRPLLPARLSYPEIFPDQYIYPEGMLIEKLSELLQHRRCLDEHQSRSLTDPYAWSSLAAGYENWLTAP